MTQQAKPRDYWEDAYGGINNYLAMGNIHNQVADLMIELYPNMQGFVVDIGGGPGTHIDLISKKKNIVPFNLDNSIMAIGSTPPNVGTLNFNLKEKCWPLPEKFFDLILSIQVLEHIEEEAIEQIAKNCFKHLKDNCDFFLSVAQEDNTDDPDHKTLKPLFWWKEIFCSVGFKINNQVTTVYESKKLPRSLGWNSMCLTKQITIQ